MPDPFDLDVTTDPYGTDLALSNDGDLVIWPNGAAGTITGTDNCIQAMIERFRTLLGELPLHPDYGSAFPSNKFVGAKLDPIRIEGEATVELQNLVDQDPRFIEVSDVRVDENPRQLQSVSITFKLGLVDGTTLAVSDLNAPVVDEVTDSDVTDLSALDDLAALTGQEFIAQSDQEAQDLADAADLSQILVQENVN